MNRSPFNPATQTQPLEERGRSTLFAIGESSAINREKERGRNQRILRLHEDRGLNRHDGAMWWAYSRESPFLVVSGRDRAYREGRRKRRRGGYIARKNVSASAKLRLRDRLVMRGCTEVGTISSGGAERV